MHPLRIDPTLNVASVATVNPCTVLLRASDLTTHRSMSMQVVAWGSLLYGGGCTTNGEHWTPLPSPVSVPRLVIEKAVWQKIEHLLEKVHPFLPQWIRSCGKTSSMVRHQPKRTRVGVDVTEKVQKLSVRQLGG